MQIEMAKHGSTEGIEIVQGMPDFMINRLAEATSEAMGEDLLGTTFGGKQPSGRLIQSILLKQKDAMEWFHKAPNNQAVSQEQMKRDGAHLLLQRARQRLDRGLAAEAKLLLEKAVEIDSGNKEAWLALATAWEALGNSERAQTARRMVE